MILMWRLIPTPVHPRACGEHDRWEIEIERPTGSSPRLRGTRFVILSPKGVRRFIPAPAGNTMRAMSSSDLVTVHPRACGEHQVFRRGPIDDGGSSPRLRGTLGIPHRIQCIPRFIPAPAGNTCSKWRNVLRQTVHPRACGEHYGRSFFKVRPFGSSPRLRGTP